MTHSNHTATIQLTPSFHDTDAMGVVWHGNYLKFFEKAREALFKQFSYGYQEMQHSGYIWPVVDARVKFIKPTIAEQDILVTASLIEFENRIKINYLITDLNHSYKIAKGYTIQVAVSIEDKEMQFLTPNIFLERFGLLK